MKWKPGLYFLGLLALGTTTPAMAADHQDGPAVLTDPTSDINDVFGWMSPDGTKVNLAMTVYPSAPSTAAFSNTVQYVFHLTSSAAFTGAAKPAETDLICQFSTVGDAECWLGTKDYIKTTKAAIGATTGAASMKGSFKIFAGLRDDAFFFNLDGFKAAAAFVAANVATVAPLLNGQNCPKFVTADQQKISAAIVGQLSHATPPMGVFPGTGAPMDHFKGLNALSIVVQVDKAAVLSGSNSLLSVWGATYKKAQ